MALTRSEIQARYRATPNGKAKAAEIQKRYKDAHPEKVAALYSAWIAKPENKDRRRAMNRGYRQVNNAKIREQEKAWLEGKPLYHNVRRAKMRAKRLGLPFDLDHRMIECPEFCPVLGMRLNYGGGRGHPTSDSPSLDRLQPELGYVASNVRVISYRANSIKRDATIEEVEKVLAYMRSEW